MVAAVEGCPILLVVAAVVGRFNPLFGVGVGLFASLLGVAFGPFTLLPRDDIGVSYFFSSPLAVIGVFTLRFGVAVTAADGLEMPNVFLGAGVFGP